MLPARRDVVLYAITLFASAFLLFQVELIAAKALLPRFGGSASVWTTCMLVFQLLLLAGYTYAHMLSERLRMSTQVRAHCVLLFLAVAQVAVMLILWTGSNSSFAGRLPGTTQHPIAEVATTLLVCVGLPFFALSSTGPLLQSWFVQLGGGQATYRLYSVSNAGSLLGLLSFPFLIEPALSTQSQTLLWVLSFILCSFATALCGWRLRRVPPTAVIDEKKEQAAWGRWPQRLLWFTLAACASGLLLATSNFLCQEVVSLPLLWVLPLALYLLTFILCFDHPRWYKRAIIHPLYGVVLLLTAFSLDARNFRVQVVMLPLALLMTCMVCHGELSRRKPEMRLLTAFYLTICAGGAAGGIFVAVVAPQIFSFFTELQLLLGASAFLLLISLLVEKESWFYERRIWLAPAIAAGALLTAFLGASAIGSISKVITDIHFYWAVGAAGLLACVAGYVLSRRKPAGFVRLSAVQLVVVTVAVCVSLALYRSTLPESGLIVGIRNFYGAIRVSRGSQGAIKLEHGQTIHGYQLAPPDDRVPTTYYGPDSTIGIVLRNHPKRMAGAGTLRVGMVGLGAGTLAAYGKPGDYFRFYEINPAMVQVASGPKAVFTYLRDSLATTSIVTGDARLEMERETARGEAQNFDVLVLDAFSGDAVPVHLLTKEAFDTYFKHLSPDGIIAVHMSSRHVNLEPVLHAIVEEFPVEGRSTFTIEKPPFKNNIWMLFSAHHKKLEIEGLNAIGQAEPSDAQPVFWTDDHTSILRLLRP